MLEDYWYIACPSAKLKAAPLAFTLFDKPLVLFRDSQGQAIVLEDRCLHRNAPLSCGRVNKDTIECPYHGWRYGSSGQLVEIPYSQSSLASSIERSIKSYLCLERDGYVWVSTGKPAEDLRPYAFPHLDESGWTSFRLDTLFTGSVAACLENFLDCPHATQVHKSWFRTPTKKTVKAMVSSLEDGAVAEYFNEPREKSVVWSLLSPAGEEMKHTDRFIAPATSRVDYAFSKGRRYIISSCCTPVSQHSTRVHTVISFYYGKLAPLIRLFFKPLSQLIIKQDVQIMKLQHDNVQRYGGPRFKVIAEDLLFQSITDWRRSIEDGSSPPAAGEITHVDLRL